MARSGPAPLIEATRLAVSRSIVIRSLPSLAVFRRLSRWSAVALCWGCARFGYDVSALDQGVDASVSAGGSAGAGGGGGAAPDGAGGAESGGGGGSDPGGVSDTGDLSGALPDAGLDSGVLTPCAGAGGFGSVVPLEGLPAPPLFGPSLSPDGRTLFFAASGDIYSARRATIDETTFFDVRPLSAVNTNLPELTPHLSRDGRTLFFARDADGTGNFRDLMETGLRSSGNDFESPSALNSLNDPFYSDLSPWLSADREELWFASSRPGGPGLFDIWRARRSNQGGGFNNPQPVAALSSTDDDSGVSLTSDGLTAVLSSSRSGTLGARDLWVATRATRSEDFAVDTNLGELNSAQNDTDPAWRSDDAELLFASDRTGESLLYSTARPCRR